MSAPAALDLEDDRAAVNLVVVGHVDSGKSTLMGHWLVQLGYVTSPALRSFRSSKTVPQIVIFGRKYTNVFSVTVADVPFFSDLTSRSFTSHLFATMAFDVSTCKTSI